MLAGRKLAHLAATRWSPHFARRSGDGTLAASLVASPAPARWLDLGTGIGSVGLFLAWRFPQARGLGVEVQVLSAAMARRSFAWNGAADRVEIRDGDFRDPGLLAGQGTFDLVTGTPPYFPIGTGPQSERTQRAPCRFEHHGGVEAYCEAAARGLAPGAPFIACEAWTQHERVEPAGVRRAWRSPFGRR